MEPDNAADRAREYAEEPRTAVVSSAMEDPGLREQSFARAGADLTEAARIIQAERSERLDQMRLIPEPESHAYFINGSCTTRISSEIQAHWVSREHGQRFELRANDEESNCIVDYFHTFCGLVSSRAGSYMEGEVAKPLMDTIERDLRRGEKIRIVGHSQGVVIAHNITSKLSREHGYAWWDRHADQIEILGYGGTIVYWAPGMEVTIYEQEGDVYADMIQGTSYCATSLKGAFGRRYTKARVVQVEGDLHSAESYFVAHSADFFLQEHIQRNGGVVIGDRLAADILQSIRHDKHGDETHRRLIDLGCRAGGKHFVDRIAREVELTTEETAQGDLSPGDYHIGSLILQREQGILISGAGR